MDMMNHSAIPDTETSPSPKELTGTAVDIITNGATGCQATPSQELFSDEPSVSRCDEEFELPEEFDDLDKSSAKKTKGNDSLPSIKLVPHVDYTEEKKRQKILELPVKKKAERAQLQAYDCKEECRKYYESLGLSKYQLEERLKTCSRHRGPHAERPTTPPGFWDHNMPSTPEAVKMGLMTDSDYLKQKESE